MSEQAYKLYWKAMDVQDFRDCEAILDELIELAMKEKPSLNVEQARAIQLANIGWMTGELSDRDQQRRVLKLFQTQHPIFGDYSSELTVEKVLRAGMTMGSMIKEGKLGDEAIEAARAIIKQP